MSSRSFAEGRRLGVALLGSTGSIGRQTVDVLDAHADRFRVVALAAGSNAAELASQAARLRPTAVAIADERATSTCRRAPSGSAAMTPSSRSPRATTSTS